MSSGEGEGLRRQLSSTENNSTSLLPNSPSSSSNTNNSQKTMISDGGNDVEGRDPEPVGEFTVSRSKRRRVHPLVYSSDHEEADPDFQNDGTNSQEQAENIDIPTAGRQPRRKMSVASKDKWRVTPEVEDVEMVNVDNGIHPHTHSQQQADMGGSRRAEELMAGGTVKQVILKDFMCHPNLKVDLGPCLTFVRGVNGSGKSALLAGLAIGLGGKASFMQRNSSLAGYIRDNAPYADISITLNNVGPEAYRPKEFGKTIKVERRIKRGGTGSTFKMKDHQGIVVSTKASDVAIMRDTLNIQLDNPTTIMTQDTSKTFLCSAKPKELYQMFMKGTQLTKVWEELTVMCDNVDRAEETIKVKNAIAETHKETIVRLEKIVEQYNNLDTCRAHLKLLKAKILWKYANDAAKEVEELGEQVQTSEDKLRRGEQIKKKHELKLTELEQVEATIAGQRTEVEQRSTEIAEQAGRLKQFYREAKHISNQSESQVAAIADEEKQLRGEKKSFLKKIDEISHKQRTAEKGMDLIPRMEAQIEELRLKLEDLEEQSHQADFSVINNQERQVSRLKNEARTIQQEINSLEEDRRKYTDERRDLETAKTNKMNKFGGEKVARLLNLIQRDARQFSKPPIGPLGNEVSLLEAEWAKGVETGLGFLMKAFFVNNGQDNQLLGKLIRDAGFGQYERPTVIVSKFESRPYDVSRNTPNCEHKTIMDVLKFSSVEVQNCFIDQGAIESTLLIRNQQQMRNFMNGSKDDRIKKCYDEMGNQCLKNPFRFYSNSNQAPPKFLGGEETATENLKWLEDRIHHHNGLILDQQAKYNQKQKELDVAIGKLNELKARENQVEVEVQKCQKQKENLEKDRDKIIRQQTQSGSGYSEMDVQKTLLAKCEEEIKAKREQLEAVVLKHSDIKTKLNELFQELKTAEAESTEFRQRNIIPLEHRLTEVQGEQKARRRQVIDLDRQMELETRALEENRKKKEDSQVVADEKIAVARLGHPEQIRTIHRSVPRLQEDAKRQERDLAQAEARLGDIDRVKAELESKIQIYTRSNGQLKLLQKTQAGLKASVTKRLDGFKHLKIYMHTEVKHYFSTLMRTRDYVGRIRFLNNQIQIMVDTQFVQREAGKASAGSVAEQIKNNRMTCLKDLKGLSGGERWYTTVCFVVSLWQAMQSPFRCMDEFDVFMDEVNRKIAMDLLIHHSAVDVTRPYLQHIFLTPLKLSDVSGTNEEERQQREGRIKVIEIPKLPERVTKDRPTESPNEATDSSA